MGGVAGREKRGVASGCVGAAADALEGGAAAEGALSGEGPTAAAAKGALLEAGHRAGDKARGVALGFVGYA